MVSMHKVNLSSTSLFLISKILADAFSILTTKSSWISIKRSSTLLTISLSYLRTYVFSHWSNLFASSHSFLYSFLM